MNTPAPAPAVSPSLTPVGRILLGTFVLSLLSFALSSCDWMQRLDAPPPNTYRVISGGTWTLNLTLAAKSIQGLHETKAILATLEVPGRPLPYFPKFTDTASAPWDDQIVVRQHLLVTAAMGIERQVETALECQVPADPALIGRTGKLILNLSLAVPRQDGNDRQAYKVETVHETFTAQLEFRPSGYRPLYRQVGTYSLRLALGVMLLGLVRAVWPQRKGTPVTEPAN